MNMAYGLDQLEAELALKTYCLIPLGISKDLVTRVFYQTGLRNLQQK